MSTEFESAGLAVIVALGLESIAGLLLLYARQRSYAGELRQSEARLRTIAGHIGEGLALYDRDDRLIFFNEPYRRMQQTATANLRPGMLFESLAMDRGRVLKAMGEIDDVNAFVVERVARHRNPDGRVIERRRPDGGYHLIREGRTADGQIVVSFVDITELKRREAALQESEGRLRAIIAAEPECVAIVAPDGDLLDMNPAGLRMLEASSLAEMRRWPFLNQIAPHYRRAFVRLQHSVLEGQSGVLEFEAFGIHGKRCWLDAQRGK